MNEAHAFLVSTQRKVGHSGGGYTALCVVYEDDFETVIIKCLVLVPVVSGLGVMAMARVTQVSVSL